jgi:hypothetical protein
MFSQIQSCSYLLFHPNSKIVYFSYSDESELVQMTWIFPHAKQILEAAQYFEIDSSFEVFKPFVFSVPLAIIDNENFPLGLQISPTESFLHYFTFIQNLEQTFNLHNFFHGKFFLSDMGTAIKQLVKQLGAKHFFCYRHLIESFGSSTFLSLVVNHLLFTSCEEEFLDILPQALSDLNHLLRIGEINKTQNKKLLKYFPIKLENNEFAIDISKHISFEQCLWKRSEHHVTSCSNHIERLHRTLKEKTSENISMAQRVVIVINELHARFHTALKNTGVQAIKCYTKLKRRAVAECLPARDSCNDPMCNWSNDFSQRFGIVDFPCIYTIQNSEIHAPNPPTFSPATITSANIVESYNGEKWKVKIYSAKNTPKLPFSEMIY